MATGVKLLRYSDLKAIKGINFSRRHLYNLEAVGKFPIRVPLGANSVAWVESEIDAYIAGCMERRGTLSTNADSGVSG